ncbi:inositol monophosphatase family protein [Rhodococcus sp. Q1]|uniref:inositol monophosphatase family protein n=1 Tax=Rhodococcus sp. Q1 TaxID=2508718 RepID=UPI001F5D5F6F|nr:inositol monophosphatase family protein [Rhodococcus sp. Q1]
MHVQRTLSESESSALRDVAVTAAREAAAYVRVRRAELFGPPGSGEAARVGTKSTATDPVTAADTESEELIRRRLAELRPEDAFLGEETSGDGARATTASGVVWVVDPIDGTVNFVYGLPASAVSVAAQVDGRSVAGAVVDIASGETFFAAEGLGAYLDTGGTRVRLRCNPVTDPRMALVATGFSYSPQRRARQGELVAALLPRVRDIRRVGAAALDLCMVAAGRVDAHYEHGLGPWDWAAGALVAAEAGAVVRVPTGTGDDGELTVAVAPGLAADFETLLTEIGAFHAIPN